MMKDINKIDIFEFDIDLVDVTLEQDVLSSNGVSLTFTVAL